MPCTTNSAHAQHTLLRGCCTSTCPCPGGASFSAEPYCPCNDTIKNRSLTYSDGLCLLLADLDGNYANAIEFYGVNGIGATGFFNSIKCGTFTITAVGNNTTITVGTVVNGVFTATNNNLSAGTYSLIIQNSPTTECASVTMLG